MVKMKRDKNLEQILKHEQLGLKLSKTGESIKSASDFINRGGSEEFQIQGVCRSGCPGIMVSISRSFHASLTLTLNWEQPIVTNIWLLLKHPAIAWIISGFLAKLRNHKFE